MTLKSILSQLITMAISVSIISIICISTSCEDKSKVEGLYLGKSYKVIEIRNNIIHVYDGGENCFIKFSLGNEPKVKIGKDHYLTIFENGKIVENSKGKEVFFSHLNSNPTPWDSLVIEQFYNIHKNAIKRKLTFFPNGTLHKISKSRNSKVKLGEDLIVRLNIEIGLINSNLFMHSNQMEEDVITSLRFKKFRKGKIEFEGVATEFSNYFCGLQSVLIEHK